MHHHQPPQPGTQPAKVPGVAPSSGRPLVPSIQRWHAPVAVSDRYLVSQLVNMSYLYLYIYLYLRSPPPPQDLPKSFFNAIYN